MKRKNILLLLLLLILGAVAVFLIFDFGKSGKDYDFSFREFALKDMSKLHKIMLYKRDGEKISLTKNGEKWIVNDKFPANPNAISNILSPIENVKIEYVPPDAAVENIMKSMMYNSIKVELFDKDNNALKKYYVGESPDNSIGTYYVMDGSASPLVMNLPGFNGNLRVRFNYTADEWRDRTVLSLKPDEITEVSMKYYFDKENSFVLSRNGNIFSLKPAFEGIRNFNTKTNNEFAKTYLLGFENKGCEYIANSYENKDDIISRAPIVEIGIKLNTGKNKTVQVFMLPKLEEEVDNEKTGLDKYLNQSILRYIARDEAGDLYLIQYEVFKDIFVTSKSFNGK